MSILFRYVIVHYLLGCIPVLLALAALFSFLVLVEELDNVGEGLYRTADALQVIALTMPARLLELLPVTLLVGGLLGLGQLARHREIVVMRAAGISLVQLMIPLLVIAGAAVVTVLAIRNQLVPELELRAAQLRARTEATAIFRDTGDSGYWLPVGDRFIHIGRLVGGHSLSNVEIYYLDDQKQVQRLIRAEGGEIVADDRWVLSGVQSWDFRGRDVTRHRQPRLVWESDLNRQQTASLVVPREALSTPDLYRYIRLLDDNQLDSRQYRVSFWQRLSEPFALVIMALLTLPFMLGLQRGGSLGRAVLAGGFLGIVFFFSEQLMGHLAVLLGISPPLAAMAPELLMGLLAFGLFHRAAAR